MIKRTLSLACAAFLLLAGSAQAQTATIGGIEYTVNADGQTASVTGYTGEPVDVAIPATVEYDGETYTITSIGEGAFYECRILQSITLPEGLQTIGYRAFFGCRALQSVTLPKGLTRIDTYAFSGSPLRDITCHAATPPFIYENTFDYDTYAAATLTVPTGAEAAYCVAEGWKLFYTTALNESILYRVSEDGQTATVVDADENITAAHIPATVNIEGINYPVTAIGNSAFENCDALQSITLPKGLQSIGVNAFRDCHSLQSIAFPEGLQSIGDGAFYYCWSLQSVTFPESLQSIESSAFSSCSLQNIACHAITPPSIEDDTFDYDTYGTAVLTVPEGVEDAYRTAEYWAWFYDSTVENGIVYKAQEDGQSATTVYADPRITAAHVSATVNIDGTDYPVTAIGDQTFDSFYSLQSITFSEGLQSIGSYAFQDCYSLQSIALPEGLQTIGDYAFTGCAALQSVTFSEGLQTIEFGAFTGCSALQSITLPQGLQSIESVAFANCTSLQSVTFPEGLQTIGDHAFQYCTALQSVTLPQGLQSIESGAFSMCYSLQSVILPEGLHSISEDTFRLCKSLQSVTLPEGLQSIESEAFAYCGVLQSITLPERLQSIGEMAFYGCTTLQNIDIPQSVTEIGSSTFSGCSALQNIILPKGLQSIGRSAFSDCSSLQSINIPQGVTEIGNSTFEDCTALQGVTLPEGLQSIGRSAFSGCSSLQSINIPQGVTGIGLWAFLHCPLRDIICLATTPPTIELYTFDAEIYETATLHVPSNAVGDYQTAECWKEFFHVEAIIPTDISGSVAADASLVTYANGILATKSPADITVYAQNGAVVRHAADATSLSLEGLPRGIYIISIAQDGQRQVMKVVR